MNDDRLSTCKNIVFAGFLSLPIGALIYYIWENEHNLFIILTLLLWWFILGLVIKKELKQ